MNRRNLTLGGASALLAACAGNVGRTPVYPRAHPFPEPRYFETDRARIAWYAEGAGVPVVFIHGVPELGFTWRRQLTAVSRLGFRAIALDLPGFGNSTHRREAGDWNMVQLADDVVALLDHLGISRAVFAGKDFGGSVMWTLARIHPDRALGFIGVGSPPFFPPGMKAPQTDYRDLIDRPNQIRWFQEAGTPERFFADEANLRGVLRRFHQQRFFWRSRLLYLPSDSPERRLDFPAIAKVEYDGDPLLAPEELDYMVEAFLKSGMAGSANLYRNLARNFPLIGERNPRWKIEQPVLYLSPTEDPIIPPDAAQGVEAFAPDFRETRIRDCSHFMTEEQPGLVNEAIAVWLAMRFS